MEDLRQFRWLEKPSEISLAHAEELLMDLGALNHVGASPTSGARCSRSRCIRATPGCCSRRRNTVVCIKPVSSPRSRKGRDLLLRGGAGDVQNDRDDLLGDKASSISGC